MTAAKRRELLLSLLQTEKDPQSATKLAGQLGVSRQIVVGDVALLRAGGVTVLATPRGYLLQSKKGIAEATFACSHNSREEMLAEFYAVVDYGGCVEDVTVENPLYGQLTGQLHISTRYEAEQFALRAESEPAGLLMNMAPDGVHLHRVTAPNEQTLEQIRKALNDARVLYHRG